ncbi:MAG: TIGR03790 family protein [Candidatus Anammoxibacter sp.]
MLKNGLLPDESHTYKNLTGQRYEIVKVIVHHSNSFDTRQPSPCLSLVFSRILTGTEIVNYTLLIFRLIPDKGSSIKEVIIRKLSVVLLIAILLSTFAASEALALSPEDIVIVYNGNVKKSKSVALYYSTKRGVPSSNLVEVYLTGYETLKRRAFETKLIPPVRKALKRLIDAGRNPAVLLVYGIPIRIKEKNDPQLYSQYKDLVNDMVREYKSMALLHGEQMEKLINDGRTTTTFYNNHNTGFISTNEIIRNVNNTITKAKKRMASLKPTTSSEMESYNKIASLLVKMTGMTYIVVNNKKRSSSYSKDGNNTHLLTNNNQLEYNTALKRQLAEIQFTGFTPEKALEASTIVRKVKGVIGELIFWDAQKKKNPEKMRSASVDSELTLVLVENYQISSWLPNPFLEKYDTLSEIEWIRKNTIMVGRLDAPTSDMTKRLVDDAMETEKKGLSGTFYIDARGMSGKKVKDGYGRYDEHLRKLYRIVKDGGCLPVVLDNNPELFPAKSCPDAALYVGWYSLAKYIDAFEWKKGSVGFHIASAEASTLKKKDSRVWCKRMIEDGIAATIGPVNEPYLASFPLPDTFFPMLMTGKFTLLEVYFKSIPFLSWRQLIVGDPLYMPFKNNPCIDLSK